MTAIEMEEEEPNKGSFFLTHPISRDELDSGVTNWMEFHIFPVAEVIVSVERSDGFFSTLTDYS